MSWIDRQQIERIAGLLAEYLEPTPLRRSAWLSERLDAEVFLKLECVQPTGSFKVRGAFSKLLATREEQGGDLRAVAASTGNHGCAVAYALAQLGGSGTVFVPETAAENKVAVMRRLGVEVRAVGTDGLEAELAAREYAEQSGLPYVSPYNDPLVVAGQGSVAVEMERQRPDLDWVIAAVGGGGLIGGIATWYQDSDSTQIVGCSPENSCVLLSSVAAGQILDQPSLPTLSDGTAGGVEAGAVTFDMVSSGVQHWFKVPEPSIEAAVVDCVREEALLVEGAAGVAVACAEQLAAQLEVAAIRGSSIAIVICGGNLGAGQLRRLLN